MGDLIFLVLEVFVVDDYTNYRIMTPHETDAEVVMLKTPLYDIHQKLGARMMDFGGWTVPVQYQGIIQEHQAVRNGCGLFDVSHMGEIFFEGPGASAALQRLITNDLSRTNPGQALYTCSCLPDGGIVDDLVVYNMGGDRFMACVNAANRDNDREWFIGQVGKECRVTDRSDEYGQLAVQGQRAEAVLADLTSAPLDQIRPFHFIQAEVGGVEAIISRTGYTGEDGFELYLPGDRTVEIWERLLENQAGDQREQVVVPCGFGARDTLRLEMRYCLYGVDMDENTNPYEAGLGWTVKLDKGDFIGREALERIKGEGARRRLVGLEVDGRAAARHGDQVYAGEDAVGTVTSGCFSPSLGRPIALARVEAGHAKVGTELEVGIRNRKVPVKIVKTPFYRRP